MNTAYVHIVRYGKNGIVVSVNYFQFAVVPFLIDDSAETHLESIFESGLQPDRAVSKPLVGKFDLFAVDDALFEYTVIVHYGKARRYIPQRRKTVEVCRGKPSETAVTESRVGLDGVKRIDIEPKFLYGFYHFFVDTHIEKVVSQRTSEKKLHRHIINVLGVDFTRRALEFHPGVRKHIAHHYANGLIHLGIACLFRFDAEKSRNGIGDCRFQSFGGNFRIVHIIKSPDWFVILLVRYKSPYTLWPTSSN